MPLSINPNDLIPFRLEADEGLPEPKPTFRLRFLTYEKRSEALTLLDDAIAAEATKDRGKAAECLNAITALCVARCEALPDGFEPTSAHLTEQELWELALACVRRPRLTEDERKNSVSRHSSSTDNSAGTAPATSAATYPPNTTSVGSPVPPATAPAAVVATTAATSS